MAIANSEIHIYLIDTTKIRDDIKKFFEILPQDEMQKVNNYKFIKNRERSIATFYYRRIILSKYTGLSPQELSFKINQYGKPSIENKNFSYIKFNYSHSNDIIIYSITRDSEIGIDIEFIKEISDMNSLVNNYFSSEEISTFRNTNNKIDQLNFFYKIWTRKEALLKAIGLGLTEDLKTIDSLCNEGSFNNISVIEFDKKKWCIQNLDSPKKYVSSIAYEFKGDVKNVLYKSI